MKSKLYEAPSLAVTLALMALILLLTSSIKAQANYSYLEIESPISQPTTTTTSQTDDWQSIAIDCVNQYGSLIESYDKLLKEHEDLKERNNLISGQLKQANNRIVFLENEKNIKNQIALLYNFPKELCLQYQNSPINRLSLITNLGFRYEPFTLVIGAGLGFRF